MQHIRVGHSPDPDDAFMFYALAQGKIDTGRYRFSHELVDIETLNRRALEGELELTAVSVHAYAFLSHRYILCSCGASMGDRYGPMVVAKRSMTLDELGRATIAVPGLRTTAYLALRLCLGVDFDYVLVPFDQILDAVSAGQYEGRRIDAGLIIHEGQLTYADQRLQLIVDTGQWWFDHTGLPLPLGANAIRSNLGDRGDPRRTRLASPQHRVRFGASRRGAQLRDEFWARAEPLEGRPVCRDVRQRVDARFRPRRASGRRPTAGRGPRGGHHPDACLAGVCRVG